MTKQADATTRAENREEAPRPVRSLWELDDDSYAAWLRAERRLNRQRNMLPLERR